MPKTDFTQYDKLPGNNTDVDGIDIAEGCAPSGINNAIRSVMSHIAELNDGTVAMTSPSAASLTITSADINGGTIAGVNIDGNITASADISFGDNNKAIFGAGSDLQIYHDGSNSYITDSGTGNLKIGGANVEITTAIGTKYFEGAANIAKLYHTGNQKLATTSTGVDVTGTVTADGLTVDGTQQINASTTDMVTFNHSTPANLITIGQDSTGDFRVRSDSVNRLKVISNGDFALYDSTGTSQDLLWDASASSLGLAKEISFTNTANTSGFDIGLVGGDADATAFIYQRANDSIRFGSNNILRAEIAASGDISFYDDTGASKDLHWDASASRLGLGTTAPSRDVHIASSVPALRLEDTDVSGLYGEIVQLSGGDLSFRADHGNVQASSSISFSVDASEHMRLDASGRLGLGTTAPSDTLHIESSTTSTGLRLHNTGTGGGEFRLLATSNAASIGGGNLAIYDQDSAAYRFVLDSSGNVGIGTSSPATNYKMDVKGRVQVGNDDDVSMNSTGDGHLKFDGNGYAGAITLDATGMHIYHNASNRSLVFGTNDTERARLDSSGNWLVGKTSTTNSTTTTGFHVQQEGVAVITRDGNAPLRLSRKTSDGEILSFHKDGTTVGSIAAVSGDIAVGTSDTGLRFYDVSDQILPHNMTTNVSRDGLIGLGAGAARFSDIYATNGTIQTSDANEKQDIEELSEAEQRVAVAAKGLLRKFRWKDSVAEKGDDARIHFGIIAQDLKAAFEAEGLDAGRYAMFINTEWTDEETGEQRSRMGVRYNQLLAFIIAAI